MKAITFDFCANLGGGLKVYAVPPSSVQSITYNHTLNLTYLNLFSKDDLIEIYCTPDTLMFTEVKTQTSAGPTYNPTIIGIIPKANLLNQEQLIRLESEYWLILFEDNNGNIRLAGDEDVHLLYNRTETTGEKIVSRNQNEFTFSCIQSHACYFIEEIKIVE